MTYTRANEPRPCRRRLFAALAIAALAIAAAAIAVASVAMRWVSEQCVRLGRGGACLLM